MSRRAPPRDYYDEDDDDIYEFELDHDHDRYSRSRRRKHIIEDDIDYTRRRSEVPIEELERLRLRERPPRDLMREGFSPRRDRYPMVVREETEGETSPERFVPFEREREGDYLPPRRRRRPRELDGEEVIIDERDRRRDRGRYSDRGFEEDDLVVRRRERDPYDYESEEFDERDRRRDRGRSDRDPPRDYENEKFVIDERERDGRRGRGRYTDWEEDDLVIRGKDRAPREYHSEDELRPRRKKPDDEREEIDFRSSNSRRRPRTRGVEEEIDMFDDSDRDHARSRGRRHREELDLGEDAIIRKKDRLPSHRHPDDQFQPILVRDDEPEDEIRVRSRHHSSPRREQVEDDEEIIVQKPKRDRGRRWESPGSDDIYLRQRRGKPLSPERSPEPIRAPPIHQDVFSHHRHIDHGFDAASPPRASSSRFHSSSDFDEVDIHHRDKRNGRTSDEDIVFQRRDEDSITPRTGPKSLDRSKSLVAEGTHTQGRRKRVRDPEEEIDMLSTRTENRSSGPETPRDAADDWSVVDAPSKKVPVEMSGAFNAVDAASQGASDDRPVGPHVMDVKNRRAGRWTEVTKSLVVKEAIERLGYEYEETRMFYYIFSYLKPSDIDELADLSDDIRRARRRRIREMHRERTSLPPPPRPPPLERFPPRPRMLEEKRIREREWILDSRR